MPVIDLHAHSTASDGTDSPAELVAAAVAAGVTVLGLTDHDTTAGWEQASDAASRYGVALLPGVEVSCLHEGRSLHLLAYLPDPEDADLAAALARTRESRDTRLDSMVAALAADGIPVTAEQVWRQVPAGATPGRPHLADALVAAGVVPDRDAAFRDLLADGSPYYVAHWAPAPREAVSLVVAAGGVPVLAHPYAVRGAEVSDPLLADLVDAGLAGIEADHRDHGAAEVARARTAAARFGLLVTGSSDYHGTGKVNRLGERTTDPTAFDRIVALGTGSAVVTP